MNKGPNCYECTHRRNLEFSAHSQCVHPAYDGVAGPLAMLVAMLHASRRGGPIEAPHQEITVKGKQHGIASGWFMHPLNYDPVWLEECTGFEAKQSTAVSGAVSQAA